MQEPERQGVRPLVALALATISFVALLIAGLGMLSLLLDADVIAVPGLGQIPGIAGTVLATAAFALTLWAAVRRPHPSFLGSPVCAVAAFLGYLAGVGAGAVVSGVDLAAAGAAIGALALGWFGLVIAVTGLVAGWGGIALVRARSDRPRWPWEDEFDE